MGAEMKAAAKPAQSSIPQPEPELTPETMLRRAEEMIPMLRDQQDDTDERGHYSDEVHRKFTEAGFYRALAPKMFGGYEFDFPTFLKLVTTIGRGNPSTAWCFTLAASHCVVLASHFEEAAQREIFGPDGDFRACHRAPPAGEWKRVEGGYRVTGVWSYSSGVPVANWFGGGGILPDKNGKNVLVTFFIPQDQVEILPDWGGDKSLGVRGSGSNSVRLNDVFVPDRYIIWTNYALDMYDPENGTPGYRLHGNPFYLGIVGGLYHLTFSAIFLGSALAALDEFEEIIRKYTALGKPFTKLYETTEVQYTYGEALTLVDSAEAIMFGAARKYEEFCERWVRDRTPISAKNSMQLWAMGRQSTLMSCQVVDNLFHAAGPRVANKGQKLQRYHRDTEMYRVHPSSQPWVTSGRAQTMLGIPIEFFSPRPS